MPRTPAKRYTTEEIERGLWAVALTGSVTRAAEVIAQQGYKIPKQTLHAWSTELHSQRYEEIRTEASGQIAERIASEAEQFMLEASRVEKLALQKLEEQLQTGDVKDIASALRNITTAKALNNDKISAPIRGRPTVITENRNADDMMREAAKLVKELNELGIDATSFVDGTAEEIEG